MRNSSQSQLLCTFSTLKEYTREIKNILLVYKIPEDKIYVLQSQSDSSQVFLTYNVDVESAKMKRYKTISVHRKRDYNVIYSINALNLMVNDQYGQVDQGYQIDWSRYRNSIVIASSDNKNIHVIPTKLLTIFRKNS